MITVNTSRSTSSKHTITFRTQPQGFVTVLCYSMSASKFRGNEGPIVDIGINIDSALEFGDYTVVLKDVVVSNAQNGYRNPDSIVGTITYTEPQYADGYKVWASPFAIEPGSDDNEIPILMNNQTDGEITAVDFDLYLPYGVTLYQEDGEYIADPGSRFKTTRIKNSFTTNITPNSDGSLHVKSYFTRTSASYVISGTSGDFLNLTLLGDAALKDGFYKIDIKNVFLNDKDIKVAPYSASVFVGQPNDAANAIIYGTYDETAISTLNNAIAKDDLLAYIDATSANFDSNQKITPANKNALLFIDNDASIGNSRNVIKNSVCDSLVLTDRMKFLSPKAFTATNASYQRQNTNSWGTICLPFGVKSDNETQYYELDSVSSDIMIFSAIDSVAPNTPAAYQTTQGALVLNQSNVAVPITPDTQLTAKSSAKSWTLIGTLENQVLTLDDNHKYNERYIYGIYDNQYVHVLQKATIPAFRAWYEYEGDVALSSHYSISTDDDPTAINDAKTLSKEKLQIYCDNNSVSLVSKENATVRIYSINGTLVCTAHLLADRAQSIPLPSGIYIINGHKIILK